MEHAHREEYFSFQEGVRRFEQAMYGLPDRVPVYAQIHDFARKEIGVSAKEFYTSPRMLVFGTLEVMEKYGIDGPELGSTCVQKFVPP